MGEPTQLIWNTAQVEYLADKGFGELLKIRNPQLQPKGEILNHKSKTPCSTMYAILICVPVVIFILKAFKMLGPSLTVTFDN